MQIRESGKSAIQTTKSMLNLGKDYTIPFGNDQETEGEETYPDPTRFMNTSARRAWRRLPERKKERYLRQSMNVVKRKSRKKNTIFVEEEKDLFQLAAKTSGDQYLKELQHTEIEKNTRQNNRFRQNKTDSKLKIEKESVTATETTMSYAVKSPTEMIKTMIMPSKTTVSNGMSANSGITVSNGMPANNGIAVSGGVQAGGASVSLAVGKKMAEAFLKTWKEQEVQKQQWKSAISSVSEQKQGTNVFKITAAVLGAVMLKMVVAFFQVVSSFLISVIAAILAVLPVTVIAVLVSVVVIIACAASATTESTASAGHGLPRFITQDMMQTFFETQESDGVPVSTGLAQLIAESGFGSYGPGGDGNGLSGLAYNYHNLFGIKYSVYDKYATGVVNLSTNEENSTGEIITIKDGFAVYDDYKSCILQRAYMVTHGTYGMYTLPYKNPCDGTYTKEAAKNYMQGIKNGGWATSSVYVESCIEHMDEYNLYQYDNMTWEDFQSNDYKSSYDGVVTSSMQLIVDTAKNNAGTYPCIENMCAAWVTGVYQAAGASIVPYGDAIDMWNVFKNTGSTDMSNIPPGAIVCGSGVGYMGSLYGHVGVYIGNGMVANNASGFSIESLQSWCAWQTATCQGHTGWIGWVYPGGVPTE